MIIVYHCYGGAHSSVVAAGIHLGLVADPERATPRELETLPYFDKNDPRELGLVHLAGRDEDGHTVVAVGRTNQKPLLINALSGIARIYGGDEVVFADTSSCINPRMIAGGILSRRLRLRSVGHPLVTDGTLDATSKLIRLVEIVKRRAKGDESVTSDKEGASNPIAYVPAGDRSRASGEKKHWGQRKVFYHCRDGVHCSMVVAGLHAGLLPVGRKATASELNALFHERPTGTIHYCGTAEGGREIYVLGCGSNKPLMVRAIKSFVRSCYPQEPFPLLFDVSRLERGKTRLGLLAKRLGWSEQGERWIGEGVGSDYHQFATMATDTANLLIRPRVESRPLSSQ